MGCLLFLHTFFHMFCNSKCYSSSCAQTAHVTLVFVSPIAMQRLPDSSYRKRKHTKNTFSLSSFGHSLQSTTAPSSSLNARAGNLTADGRRAAVQALPLQRSHNTSASGSAPATTLDNNDDWLDVPMDEPPPPDTRNGRKRRWYATTV
jgi:hypothetical protein